MGWGSATGLFDDVLDAVLEYVPESEKDWVVYKLWDTFTDSDWDTWDESRYVKDIVAALKTQDLERYKQYQYDTLLD